MNTSLVVLGAWASLPAIVAGVTAWHEARLARFTRAANPDNRSLSAISTRKEG